jgi:hypothetical protein
VPSNKRCRWRRLKLAAPLRVVRAGKEPIMEQEVHKNTDDARAGSTPHIVRYVLTISLVLALVAMVLLLLWGSTTT